MKIGNYQVTQMDYFIAFLVCAFILGNQGCSFRAEIVAKGYEINIKEEFDKCPTILSELHSKIKGINAVRNLQVDDQKKFLEIVDNVFATAKNERMTSGVDIMMVQQLQPLFDLDPSVYKKMSSIIDNGYSDYNQCQRNGITICSNYDSWIAKNLFGKRADEEGYPTDASKKRCKKIVLEKNVENSLQEGVIPDLPIGK